jgi:hypothetical protein
MVPETLVKRTSKPNKKITLASRLLPGYKVFLYNVFGVNTVNGYRKWRLYKLSSGRITTIRGLFRSRRVQKEKVDFLQALNENICSLEMTAVLAAIEEAIEGRLLAAEDTEPSDVQTEKDLDMEEFLVVKVFLIVYLTASFVRRIFGALTIVPPPSWTL